MTSPSAPREGATTTTCAHRLPDGEPCALYRDAYAHDDRSPYYHHPFVEAPEATSGFDPSCERCCDPMKWCYKHQGDPFDDAAASVPEAPRETEDLGICLTCPEPAVVTQTVSAAFCAACAAAPPLPASPAPEPHYGPRIDEPYTDEEMAGWVEGMERRHGKGRHLATIRSLLARVAATESAGAGSLGHAELRDACAHGVDSGVAGIPARYWRLVAALLVERDALAARLAEAGEWERETLDAAVATLRARLDATVRGEGDPSPPLRDALIGQRSDPTFCTQWDENKAALVSVLDALDALAAAREAREEPSHD